MGTGMRRSGKHGVKGRKTYGISSHSNIYMCKVKHAGNELNKEKSHGDVPEMAGNVWGKDTTHAESCSDTMPCVGVMGTVHNESARSPECYGM